MHYKFSKKIHFYKEKEMYILLNCDSFQILTLFDVPVRLLMKNFSGSLGSNNVWVEWLLKKGEIGWGTI